jgi:hypothetical protein
VASDADIFAFANTDFIDTFWFLPLQGGDLIACLYRTADGVRWLRMRAREYRSPDPFDDRDSKRIEERALPANESDDESRTRVQGDLDRLRAQAGAPLGSLQALSIMGGPDALFQTLVKQPWAHFRRRDGAGGDA